MTILLSPAGDFKHEELTDICLRLQAVGIEATIGHDFPLGSIRISGRLESRQVEHARTILGLPLGVQH